MKSLVSILFCIAVTNSIWSQNKSMSNLEMELVREFRSYRLANDYLRFDSLKPILIKKTIDLLSIQESMQFPFDSLAEYVKIISSIDGKFRVFSWDELTGGTMHDMAVIVQYRSKNGEVKTERIDGDIGDDSIGFTDAIQFQVHDILINKQPYYLCFGWGTYGSGLHHNTIMVFRITNDNVELCESCVTPNYSFLQGPRSGDFDLQYDPELLEISFNDFLYDISIGDYKKGSYRLKLRLIDGCFKIAQ